MENNIYETFKIKINDGFCEYEYSLSITDSHSIDDLATKIFIGLGLSPENAKGKLIWSKPL